MSSLYRRPFSGTSDLQLMLDLLVAVRPADRITDYPGIVDLCELLSLKIVCDNTLLWFGESGSLKGFTVVDHFNNLLFEVEGDSVSLEIEKEIVEWGVECVRRTPQEQGQSVTLDASCRDDDYERIEMLERNGFFSQGSRTLQMARPLNDSIPSPSLPEGFFIRPADGEQEAEALVALHRAAFGTDRMTVEERLAMMRGAGYDPELDLAAVAPDGRLAATCMCSISLEENHRSGRNEGFTDPVATHPDFQRRGLAKALLLTGMHKLKQRGAETALLGTSSENTAMQRAAESAGFRLVAERLWFAKPIDQMGENQDLDDSGPFSQ